MKKKLGLLILAALCAVTITLSGCVGATETMSESERMNAFIADVNAKNWSGLKEHTSTTSIMYALADDDFWETNFTVGIPWEVTATGTTSVATGGALTYTFTLVESTPNYFVIKKINNGVIDFFY